MKGGNRVIPKYTQTNSFVSKDNSPPKPKSNNPNFHILGNYFNGISVSDSILKADIFIQTNF